MTIVLNFFYCLNIRLLVISKQVLLVPSSRRHGMILRNLDGLVLGVAIWYC
jgi:hypothetical protein